MNIVKVAKNAKDIVSGPPIVCSKCEQKWYSAFDKLYISVHEKCVECSTPEEVEENMDNIFAIVNEVI